MRNWMLVLSFLFAMPALASQEVLEFKSAEHEDRYKTLISQIRCLVCQNQTISDSNAELAVDLRRKTYKMVQQDKNEVEIVDYMVARYGEFVMYKPRMAGRTLLLWVLPFILLLFAVFMLMRVIRKRKADSETAEVAIDKAALNKASDLLADNDQAK